jgi:hypothetical protein
MTGEILLILFEGVAGAGVYRPGAKKMSVFLTKLFQLNSFSRK